MILLMKKIHTFLMRIYIFPNVLLLFAEKSISFLAREDIEGILKAFNTFLSWKKTVYDDRHRDENL